MMIIIIQLFYLPAVGKQVVGKTSLGKTSVEKKRFFGHCPNEGGGLPMPGFLAPFFYQLVVLKMAIFYSNFTVIVCFLVIFVIIIIKITTIIIIIIIATIIIIIKEIFFGHTRKTSFLTSKKRTKLPELGSQLFCSKNLDLRHYVANVAKYTTYALRG